MTISTEFETIIRILKQKRDQQFSNFSLAIDEKLKICEEKILKYATQKQKYESLLEPNEEENVKFLGYIG